MMLNPDEVLPDNKLERRSGSRHRMRQHLRRIHGECCHWCGNMMLFDVTIENQWFPTIEHLDDSVFSEKRSNKSENLRLAHRICNQRRNRYGSRNKGNIERFDYMFDKFIQSIRIKFELENLNNSI